MQNDEKDIIDYLKGWPGSFVSGKEIARKVGGKERFDKDHGWAIPVLAQMVRLGMIETDHLGHFRLKPEVKKKRPRHEHVSPQILKILKSSGKSFEGVSIEDDPAESDKPPIPYYPKSGTPPAAAKANED
jgi:hypothetical protein